MSGKGLRDLLAEANAVIDVVSAQEAQGLLDDPMVVFVDVRESQEREQATIPGSIHAPRGFLEMIADPATQMHNPALSGGKRLVLFCGSGARSALAGKTLKDMGLRSVTNLVGGIQAWEQSGGPIVQEP